MEFKVVFSPYEEFSVERESLSIDQQILAIDQQILASLGNTFRERKTRILPEKGKIGIYILDLYRKTTGDDQVGISDIPSNITKNWRDDRYFVVSIDEKTARSSGRFLDYDTFYCKASFDVMMKFEALDIQDRDAENPKLIISIDGDRILREWIKQKYPRELSMPEETESEN